jgi:hypothetical protein
MRPVLSRERTCKREHPSSSLSLFNGEIGLHEAIHGGSLLSPRFGRVADQVRLVELGDGDIELVRDAGEQTGREVGSLPMTAVGHHAFLGSARSAVDLRS